MFSGQMNPKFAADDSSNINFHCSAYPLHNLMRILSQLYQNITNQNQGSKKHQDVLEY